ncbi:F-box protein PP2-B10-like [Benincasa hispida]|uniref:F-box protein PP2-B10-like n=1 Tax=Benincasa hispida TaxID=102211 RepID=UPI0018FF2FF5|nr:F-box protein PP2-B10-like [Benincasa hispida]
MEYETRMETEREENGDLSFMPEGVIANLLSFTTPIDACSLSAVSRIFNAAAQSDFVWDRFLPTDCDVLIAQRKSVDPISSSKKEIFFSLCNNPVLIDDGNKSLSLEKWSGKKCIMLGARDLSIIWGDTSLYWSWDHHPRSRFAEVAILLNVCWLEIRGRISCRILSPKTTYAVYFVFRMRNCNYEGFNVHPADATVRIIGTDNHGRRSVCLDPHLDNPRRWQRRQHAPWSMRPPPGPSLDILGLEWPQERRDGWFEIELGEFENGDGDDEVEIALMEVKSHSAKTGLVVEGIEIRPKHCWTLLKPWCCKLAPRFK